MLRMHLQVCAVLGIRRREVNKVCHKAVDVAILSCSCDSRELIDFL